MISTNITDETAERMPPYFRRSAHSGALRVCCPLLAKHIRETARFLFVRYPSGAVQRFWYAQGVYRAVTDDEVRGRIMSYITDCDETALRMREVDEVFRILTADSPYFSPDDVDAHENLINFTNGILDLGTGEMLPHSPLNLMTVQIPCDYNPDAPEPAVFNAFLDDLTEGDADKRRLLLEFMGACLSNVRGFRFKKALFLVGEGNTGKSQLRALTERLLGERNVCAIDLTELEARFGTSMLCGKRLAGSSDTGFLPVSQMKIFKQLTGGDSVFMERKGKDGFHAVYKGLLWFCTNELPLFGGDRGAWVYERMLIVRCRNVIPPEKQDKFLCEKMYAEREGIVRLCIAALREAIARGYAFTAPDDVAAEQRAYEQQNSPAVQFFIECCESRGAPCSETSAVRSVRRAFQAWCRENGPRGNVSPQRFNSDIASFLRLPRESLQRKSGGQRHYVFHLTDNAREAYGA